MPAFVPANPLIVQSDRSVLVEVDSPRYEAVRDQLARFAELEKSPEHVHTYRITPLSLWNAAASGLRAEDVVATLAEYGKYELPDNVRRDVADQMDRYGRIKLVQDGAPEALFLVADDPALLAEVAHHKLVRALLAGSLEPGRVAIAPGMRGPVKQALLRIGYPPEDLAGYEDGERLAIGLRDATRTAEAPFALRAYQREAAEIFHAGGALHGGSGVIVLPCGAGKTVVGLGVMASVEASTLIITPSTVAARQWIEEIVDKTDVPRDSVGEYTGDVKEVRPITITTYQTLTYRRGGHHPHLAIFDQRPWGLIVYDEVHLLPAPVFRATANIQARRRLGLTATLVREDGRADDVFALIGPKKYDVPWKDLERQGWIATADCTEVRLDLSEDQRMAYALADDRLKYAVAAQNPDKLDLLAQLLEKHQDDTVLIIGQYLEQLQAIAERFGLPLVTGKTSTAERERRYAALREGRERQLVVSKVANFAIDLPDANVAIQMSGTFGSRQEEAQRLGRILRPKSDGRLAHFYALVSRDTRDQEFAANRQMFLTEQGYRYRILYAHELPNFVPEGSAAHAEGAGR